MRGQRARGGGGGRFERFGGLGSGRMFLEQVFLMRAASCRLARLLSEEQAAYEAEISASFASPEQIREKCAAAAAGRLTRSLGPRTLPHVYQRMRAQAVCARAGDEGGPRRGARNRCAAVLREAVPVRAALFTVAPLTRDVPRLLPRACVPPNALTLLTCAERRRTRCARGTASCSRSGTRRGGRSRRTRRPARSAPR